ncbi:hypothetical protein BCR37DRAFT_237488 [Protomyces lactucae-debilis]|uniref:GAF domain-like protein n=1 Tax=Protomyces lactucae-debilis TaxID=2754530 RepID=A0A1Y2FN99_PROLT|nr:uncharacterized protein BCR37DRAFT_237488 [Protomyces lactucae-debilis]ORY85453.1 hypothetical protein BCR37DRAFT_237488 [Protomyces lactucae-debilis]
MSNESTRSLPAAKRVFPARTLIQSPTSESPPGTTPGENPFAALAGLRPHSPDPSTHTAQQEGDMLSSDSGGASKTTERTMSYTQERQQQQKDTQDAQDADAILRKSHVEHDRVCDNQGTVTVNDQASTTGAESSDFTTRRFEYKTGEDGTHLVDTGLQQDINNGGVQKCEDEPIHMPGAVQGFGVIMTLSENNGKLIVHHVSENCKEVLGLSAKYLFGLEDFYSILPQDDKENLEDQLDYLEESNSSDAHITLDNTSAQDAEANVSPEVFILQMYQEDMSLPPTKCWCAIHRMLVNGGLVTLEFELLKDTKLPLVAQRPGGNQETRPGFNNKAGMEGEGFDAFSEEDLLLSTVSASKPLRRIRRSVIEGEETGTMEIFSLLSQINEQLSEAQDLKSFLKVVVGLVKEITKFHRVMVYQFDEHWNGQVVAELVDWNETKDLFQGLHFPATDIPAQARQLYKVNKVRVLYDRDLTTARLLCRSRADLEKPLDMTHSFLRAMSPIHMKYLANMGVRASMSISITAFGQLWGLIACHTYGQTSMRCSFLIRKLCRLMSEQISHNIERLSYAARLTARKIIHSPNGKNPSGYIVSRAEDLLGLFDADVGILSIGDEGKILGHIENTQEAMALREYFRTKGFNTIKPSSDLAGDFPDLCYEPGFKVVAGVLFVPLSRSGDDFLLFFRRGQLKKVHWAGNPYEKVLEKNSGQGTILLPRQSFKVWSESVLGRCNDWTEDQIETAAVLCLVYGKFIEIWRERKQALQTSRLASLLLSNAGHEVRTPLNAIINYLEIALEGNLEPEVRESLTKSHTASKSLVYVINDLLDLTRSEAGKELFRNEAFDLGSAIREAMSMYRSVADRGNVELSVKEDPTLPRRVMGDQAKIRQVVGNVTANALKHTEHGEVSVETKVLKMDSQTAEVAIIVTDTGCGLSEQKLDTIFQSFELIDSMADQQLPTKDSERGTGLGLAIVARIVRNMNGQLRAESKVGRGSKFTFVFNFQIARPHLSTHRGLSPDQSVSTRKQHGANNSSQSADISQRKTTTNDSADNLPPSTKSATYGSSMHGRSTGSGSSALSDGVIEVDEQGGRAWPSNAIHQENRRRVRLHPATSSSGSLGAVKQALDEQQRSISNNESEIEQFMGAMMQSPSGSAEMSNDSIPTRQRSSAGKLSGSAGPQRSSDSGSGGVRSPLASGSGSGRSSARGSAQNSASRYRTRQAGRELSQRNTRPPISTSGGGGSVPEASSTRSFHDRDHGLETLSEDTGSSTGRAPIEPHIISNYDMSKQHLRAVKMDSTDVRVPQRYAKSPVKSTTDPTKKLNSSNSGGQNGTHSGLPSHKALHVLVAEDDAINRTILKKRLELDNHTVELTIHGLECYEVYSKDPQKFDVILMDMQMPVLSGMDATKKIREFEETCYADRQVRIPIVAVSASLIEKQVPEALEAGLCGWILKPVSISRLRQLFAGLNDAKIRQCDLYGNQDQVWENGGWLTLDIADEI